MHGTHLEGGLKWITMPWGRAELAAAEQERSRRAARQQPVVRDTEGANWEVPVVTPDVGLLRAELGRGWCPAALGLMQASMEESGAWW